MTSLARACEGVLRKQDMLARYGGEEFVILFPATASDGACLVAERLRLAIETLEIAISANVTRRITASIGIATLDPQICNAAQLLNRADEALYESKHNGKNRWTLAQPQEA